MDIGSIAWYKGHPAMKLKPKHDRRRYDARARIAKALAHPSRLMMLDALDGREVCVCDLAELVGADQSTVSKHLSILKQAGLVADRKEGVMVLYSLKACCLQGFWDCLEQVLAANLKTQQAVLR